MVILIADDVHELLINGLTELGHTVLYEPEIDRTGIINRISRVEGLVIRTKTTVDSDVLLHAKELRFIARAGAGLDNIDTEYCALHRIVCMNAGEANADAVGEQTLGMLLSLMANITKSDSEIRNKQWDRQGNTGEELSGKTVGIIGYGNTGKAVARKLRGFDVHVLAYDKYVTGFGNADVQEVTLETLKKEADIVSFHVPLTKETLYLADYAFLTAFQKPIYLLNLSRGKVVSAPDLVKLLSEGKIIGAGLDVLENENINDLNEEEQKWFSYFISSNRVVLTPHTGGWTRQSYMKIAKVLLQKIKQLTKT